MGEKKKGGGGPGRGGDLIQSSMHAEQLFWDYPDSNVRLTLMLFSSPPIVWSPSLSSIIRALWSEQHGNNVSRRHAPSDGPLTALRHHFLSFFLSSSPPSPSLSRLSVWSSTSSLHFIFCLFVFPFAGVEPSSPPHCCFPSPHVWPLISTSIINWSLISGWLIQEDHNNEDTDNAKKKKKKKAVETVVSRYDLRTCSQSLCCQIFRNDTLDFSWNILTNSLRRFWKCWMNHWCVSKSLWVLSANKYCVNMPWIV